MYSRDVISLTIILGILLVPIAIMSSSKASTSFVAICSLVQSCTFALECTPCYSQCTVGHISIAIISFTTSSMSWLKKLTGDLTVMAGIMYIT